MYYIRKQFEISGSHSLQLSYPSKCSRIHGHNWLISVYCRAAELNADGMVVDFSHIKALISDTLDHRHLNDIFDFNPTAENIARWIGERVPECYRVDIQESRGNVASWVADDVAAIPQL